MFIDVVFIDVVFVVVDVLDVDLVVKVTLKIGISHTYSQFCACLTLFDLVLSFETSQLLHKICACFALLLVQWVRGTGQISWEKCQPQLWLSSS